MGQEYSVDFPEYVQPAKAVWEQNAFWWDSKIGDGNDYQNYLIEPQTERLLELKAGEKVLDIACGAGRFARRMAAAGARVTAIDHSENFIGRARERGQDSGERIDYRVMSTDDTAALKLLGERQFEAAVCTMALMDMACITPLISFLPRLLKPGGRFVFSVMHPVFSSGSARLYAEQTLKNDRFGTETGVKITEYAEPFVFKGEGIVGQPAPQFYFHRPVGRLFNTFFKYGFTLDGIEESTFPKNLERPNGSALSFFNARTLPPILVARMRIWRQDKLEPIQNSKGKRQNLKSKSKS